MLPSNCVQNRITRRLTWETPVPEVMAVDFVTPLLADHDVLEAGKVEVAPDVELPEPEFEDQLLPRVGRVARAVLAFQVRARRDHRRGVRDRLEQREDLARLCRLVVLGLGLIEAIVVEQRLAQIELRRFAAGMLTSANRRCCGSRPPRSSTLTKPRVGSPASSMAIAGMPLPAWSASQMR